MVLQLNNAITEYNMEAIVTVIVAYKGFIPNTRGNVGMISLRVYSNIYSNIFATKNQQLAWSNWFVSWRENN